MTHVGQSYEHCSLAEQRDVIVIGSGIGGLTTAALLARHGGQRVRTRARGTRQLRSASEDWRALCRWQPGC